MSVVYSSVSSAWVLKLLKAPAMFWNVLKNGLQFLKSDSTHIHFSLSTLLYFQIVCQVVYYHLMIKIAHNGGLKVSSLTPSRHEWHSSILSVAMIMSYVLFCYLQFMPSHFNLAPESRKHRIIIISVSQNENPPLSLNWEVTSWGVMIFKIRFQSWGVSRVVGTPLSYFSRLCDHFVPLWI